MSDYDKAIHDLQDHLVRVANIVAVLEGQQEKISELENKKRPQTGGALLNYDFERVSDSHFRLRVAPESGDSANPTTERSGDEFMDKLERPVTRVDGRVMVRFAFNGKTRAGCGYGKTEELAIADARKKLRKMKEAYKDQGPVRGSDEKSGDLSSRSTLHAWFWHWMETFRKKKLKGSTYKLVAENYRRWVEDDPIDKMPIGKIEAEHVQAVLDKIPFFNPREKVFFVLGQLFRFLFEKGKTKHYILADVVLPKRNGHDEPEDQEKEPQYLLYENEKILFERIKEAKCRDAAMGILYSGLRDGEAMGLMSKDVSLDLGKIRVTQQWNSTVKSVTSPKSVSGYRDIPMLDEFREIAERRLKNPDELSESGFFFGAVRRLTQNLCSYSKILGFRCTPHLLRHTFASRCYAAGISQKQLQEWLGHANLSMTDAYTHALPTSENEIIDKMHAFFVRENYLRQ